MKQLQLGRNNCSSARKKKDRMEGGEESRQLSLKSTPAAAVFYFLQKKGGGTLGRGPDMRRLRFRDKDDAACCVVGMNFFFLSLFFCLCGGWVMDLESENERLTLTRAKFFFFSLDPFGVKCYSLKSDE